MSPSCFVEATGNPWKFTSVVSAVTQEIKVFCNTMNNKLNETAQRLQTKEIWETTSPSTSNQTVLLNIPLLTCGRQQSSGWTSQQTKKHYPDSSISIAVSSFNVLLLAKKYQTSATHTRISQYFVNITSAVAVIGVNVTLSAFRRDPVVQRLRWLAQRHSKSVVGLGKVVSFSLTIHTKHGACSFPSFLAFHPSASLA